MRKYKSIFIIVLFLISNKVICQDFSDSWAGHFSYLNIVDISEGENKIYAASDNTIFSYDLIANEINEITTINGLSGEFISTIHYDEVFELVIIGYENGLMEIYFEDGRDVLTIIDIRDKPTIPADKKIINHFNLNDNLVYISTNYGISVYDLENLEFGDTYFIGDNGTQIRVNQTTILGDYIYAACYDLGGVRKALVASPNLINFQEWDKIRGGNWRFIQNVDGNLYAVRSSRKLFTIDQSDVFTEIFVYDALPSDMVNSNNYLLITTSDNVFVYDSLFNEIATVNQHPDFITEYSCAVLFPSNDLFIGSENIFMNNQTSLGANQGKKIKSGFGVLKTNLNELELFEEIHPNGPLLNTPFSIEGQNGNLWCVYGGYSVTYSFNAGTAGTGISKYVNQEWFNKPYDSILSTVTTPFIYLILL